MEAAAIIQLIMILLPVAEKAGVDIANIIQGIQAGKTTEELIIEAENKKNDLPDLSFGVGE